MSQDNENNNSKGGMRRINRSTTNSYSSFTDSPTEIEFCDYGGPKGIFLLPADPNWGGGMHTHLTDSLFKYFSQQKISTMRFSFTKYQIFNNNYDKYITQAAICLEEFIRSVEGLQEIWLVGYSFGSLVGLNLALRRPDVKGVIMISPPVLNYDYYSWFMAFSTNVLLVYGTKDHLIPGGIIEAYGNYLAGSKVNISISSILGADHVLNGKGTNIGMRCLDFIENINDTEEEQAV